MNQWNEVYLIRHAEVETTNNKNNDDPGLSNNGKMQIEFISRQLIGIQFGNIWHSSLKRSRETAALIVGCLKNTDLNQLNLIETELLNEEPNLSDYKNAQVQVNVDKQLEWRGIRKTIHFDETPQGKVARSVLSRGKLLWNRIFAEFEKDSKPDIIVGHGGIFNALICAALKKNVLDFLYDFDNASVLTMHWKKRDSVTIRIPGGISISSKRKTSPSWVKLEGDEAIIFDGKIIKVREFESARNHQENMYSRPIHARRLEYIEDRLRRIVAGKKVLDIGCAEGRVCNIASGHGAKEVHGIDSSKSKIHIAQAMNPNCFFDVADIFGYEKEDKFDVVLCLEFLQHVRDYRRCINIICNLVKEGGHLIISVPNRSLGYQHRPAVISAKLSETEMLKEIGGAGFGVQNALWSFSAEKLLSEILSTNKLVQLNEIYFGDEPWQNQPLDLARRVFLVAEYKKKEIQYNA
jgi:broad specificity phosphatase PhoE/trans-aconitate methyltransferase